MNDCRTYEPLIAELLFGGLHAEEQAGLEAHLAACPGCRERVGEMQAALRLAAARTRPQPEPAFWDGYYARLEGRMAQNAPWSRRLAAWWQASRRDLAALAAPAWRLQLAAAVALLVVGVLIGWLVFGPGAPEAPPVAERPGAVEAPPRAGPPVAPAPSAEATPPRAAPPDVRKPSPAPSVAAPPVQRAALDERASRYLERSKVLLLGLVNLEPAAGEAAALNLPRERELARALVQEAGPLQAALTAADQQRLRALIADLEVILLQIANLESGYDVPAIELVRSGVDRRGILLKINLTEMQQEGAGVQPAVHRSILPDSTF